MRNYTCPTCHTGRRAPERMAPNDARRYCLTCSAKAKGHKLVEMVVPAIQRKKHTTAVRRTTQAAKRADAKLRRETREGDATFTARVVSGVDVDAWVEYLCKVLHCLRPYEVKIVRHKASHWQRPEAVRGMAYTTLQRITLGCGLGNAPAAWKVQEILLHECVHLCVDHPTKVSARAKARGMKNARVHHGHEFKRTLCAAAKDVWGIVVDPKTKGKYGCDKVIEDALRARGLANNLVLEAA